MSSVFKCEQGLVPKVIKEAEASTEGDDAGGAEKTKETAEAVPGNGREGANKSNAVGSLAMEKAKERATLEAKDVLKTSTESNLAAGGTAKVVDVDNGMFDADNVVVEKLKERTALMAKEMPNTSTESNLAAGGTAKVDDADNGNFDAPNIGKPPMPFDLEANMGKKMGASDSGGIEFPKEKTQFADAGQRHVRHEKLGKEQLAKALATTEEKVKEATAANATVGVVDKKIDDETAQVHENVVRPVATITKPTMTVEDARYRRMSRTIKEYDLLGERRQLAAAAATPRHPLLQQDRPAPSLPKPNDNPKPAMPAIVEAVLLDRGQAAKLLAKAMALEGAELAAKALKKAAAKAENDLGAQRVAAELELSQHLPPTNAAVASQNATVVQAVLRRAQVRSESRASSAMGSAMARAKRSEGALTAAELTSRVGLGRINTITAAVTRELTTAPAGADLPQLLVNFNTFSAVVNQMHRRQEAHQPLPKQPRLVTASPATSMIVEESEPSISSLQNNGDDSDDRAEEDATAVDDEELLTTLVATFGEEPSAVERLVLEGAYDDEGVQQLEEEPFESSQDDDWMEVSQGSFDGRNDDEPVHGHVPFNFTLNLGDSSRDAGIGPGVFPQPGARVEAEGERTSHRTFDIEMEEGKGEEEEDEEEEETSEDTFELFYRHRAAPPEDRTHADEERPQPDGQQDEYRRLDDLMRRAREHFEPQQVDLAACAKVGTIFTAAVRQRIEAGVQAETVRNQAPEAERGAAMSPIYPDDTTLLLESSGDVVEDMEQEEVDGDETMERLSEERNKEWRFQLVGQAVHIAGTTRPMGPHRPPPEVVRFAVNVAQWALVPYVQKVNGGRDHLEVEERDEDLVVTPPTSPVPSPHRQPPRSPWSIFDVVDRQVLDRDIDGSAAGHQSRSTSKRKLGEDAANAHDEGSPLKRQHSGEEHVQELRFVLIGQATHVAGTIRPMGPHRPPPEVVRADVDVEGAAAVAAERQAEDVQVMMDGTPPPSPIRHQNPPGSPPQQLHQAPPSPPIQQHIQLPPQGPPAGGPIRKVRQPPAWNRPPGQRIIRNRGVPTPRRALGPRPATVRGTIDHELARIDRFLQAIIDLLDAGGDGLNGALDQQRLAIRARTSLRRLSGVATTSMEDVLKVLHRVERANQGFPVTF